MPALGGAAAQPLRFLDFLIYEPVRAVLLHGAGVPVLVPAPERYAVHKLIVADRRRTDGDSADKRDKDLRQAGSLIAAMVELNKAAEFTDAYAEAWERGPAWREAIIASVNALGEDLQATLRAGLATGIKQLGLAASAVGLAGT